MIDEDELPQDTWCTKMDTRLSFGRQMGSEQDENVRIEGKETVKAQMRYPGFRVLTSHRILMSDGVVYNIHGVTDQNNTHRILDLILIAVE